MNETVYLNGNFVVRENAVISPDDRGFLFADGVYEVIKCYNGKAFRMDDHLSRLERSLKEIGIIGVDVEKFNPLVNELLLLNNFSNAKAGIYIQITRGTHQRVHYFPKNIQPTIYAYAFELPSSRENLEKGIKTIVREDIRWHRCDIKSVALLPNTMLFNQAVDAGAGETILTRNGKVTEATHSSVLGVKNGKVITHPLSNFILPGITRKVILEICTENHIPVVENAIAENELFELDELMIAGTGTEVMPVVQVEDQLLGNKKPGEITRFIQQKFFELI